MPDKLFPQIHYQRQKARLLGEITASPNPPFTRYELACIQKALLTDHKRAPCPRCGEPFAEVARRRHGAAAREAWTVRCVRCRRHAVIPVHRDHEPGPPKFAHLEFSDPKKKGAGITPTVVGVAIGFSFFLGAAVASEGPRRPLEAVVAETSLVYLAPLESREQPASLPSHALPVFPTAPRVASAGDIPVPAIEVQVPVTAPHTTLGHVPAGRETVGSAFDGLATRSAGAQSPWTAPVQSWEVDELPEVLVGAALRYPPELRAAGVEGRVTLDFVVDTLGRVESESIQVTGSTHAGFDVPARDVVIASVYRPGRIAGRAVRVYVTLTVTFSLGNQR